MTDDTPIIVEPVAAPAAGRWAPVAGPETLDFLSTVVPEASRDDVRDAAVSILSKSVPPTGEAGQETGLIVGYVQSGKTMSFETVAALARDNAFQIVIVVAGTANPLLDQSTGRLRRDLRLDEPDRARRWIQFQNPSADDATVQTIRDVLDDWRDPGTPEEYKKTVLITVLKNYRRLQNLADLVQAVGAQAVPVLIIDDEADQASLNTEVAQGQESTTYRCLMALRQALPSHTYLQYTATPQAPLLVSIIDSLSPNFVQVLEPGEPYVGGREFFADNLTYVRVIPPQEVPTNSNPLTEPPESLLDALRVFMVGVTAGIREGRNTGNRSMLVHPSHRTAQHQEFYNWVRDIFDDWKRILNLPDNDPDKQELIEDFRGAYDGLAQTVGDALPDFDALVPSLRFAFRNTRVLEVNARGGRTPPVDWRSAYGWILVGGQAMDRGFTVEGLTVTYMPRGIGVGNADTVQQRARFFGYKRSYLGYCRVYLEQGTLRAFQTYVEHEEDIRGQLEEFQVNGHPLNDWKRAFVLDTALRPCRNHVLEFDYMRGRFSNDWVAPRVVLASDAVVQANRRAVAGFVQGLVFGEDDGHLERTDVQRHHVCHDISLRTVIEQLLINMRITGTTDSQRNTGLLLQLSKALEDDADELCTIYRISPATRRRRGIDENGEVTNLFQGEAPVHPRERRGEIYPGDRAIRDADNVTIQIHTLNLTRDDEVVAENVPVLAVWVPSRLARAWITQDGQ
ncbi:Z1 domain-containing protein [Salinicola peritrichatus]|uniref:Z1 domain-containing protein n=1 Tax=Salinicola peritrichatus TaxID=1267424 RepID=UPI000DA225F9|nr:Z1 domain-containing protein [Salinicola peritrichatus]